MMNNLACVILGAGEGTRMKSGRAKVVHEVCGVPLIGHVLAAAKAVSPERIVVVVGHQAEEVKKCVGEGVEFVVQEEQRGTGHAVMQVAPFLAGYEGSLLILSGDVPLLTAETLGMLVREHHADVAACTLLTAVFEDATGYGRIQRGADGMVTGIVEEKDAPAEVKASREVNAGVYCFSAPQLLGVIGNLSADNRQGEFYLTDVIGLLVEEGEKINAIRLDDPEEIAGINTRVDLARVEGIFQERIQKQYMRAGVTIVDPRTTRIGMHVEIGADTIIHPFTCIEGGVTVGRNCRVGPFSHLRKGTVLKDGAEIGNFVEVKNAVIGEKSKAKHLSYLGDARVGKNVNVGAGSITANYDGKEKHVTEIGDGAFIGSGTTLVAPVSVGKGAVTGAGSVVLKGRDVADGETVVGVPAKRLKV